MSDSELSDSQNPLPDASTIDATLRRIVRDASKASEEITIRIARTRAETELGLDRDFFKNDSEWKDRSKSVITAAVEDPESPEKPKPKSQKKPTAKASAGKKRKSDGAEEQPKKRARKSPILDSDNDEDVEESSKSTKAESRKAAAKKTVALSDEEDDHQEELKSKPKTAAKKRAASKEVVDSDDLSGEEASPKKSSSTKPKSEDESALSDTPDKTLDVEDVKTSKLGEKANPAAQDDDDDSDMSVLIDEPPAKKKRHSKSSPSKAKGKKTAAGTKKATTAKSKAAGKELSPDDEEIKRLQGWLVKCGLRKVWSKELALCNTPKAKISHLKSMLTDAGMTGRYSAEKAKQIKEARELKAEIEAANEFNEQWGKEGEGNGDEEESEEEVKESKPRPGGRTLPKGLVDFGDSGDDGSD